MGLFCKISGSGAKDEIGHNSVEFFSSPPGVAEIILCYCIRITHGLGIVSSFIENVM